MVEEGIAFMGLGFVAIIIAAYQLVMSYRSSFWAHVPGKIIKSRVGEPDDDWIRTPEIVYEYNVGGTPYNGDSIHFGEAYSNLSNHAQVVVQAYPEGRPVTVFYDPGNPAKAILHGTRTPWFDRAMVVFLLTGLVLLFLGSLWVGESL